MAVPVSLRGDFGEAWLRGLARKTKDGPQARRRLALAAIYDGATRTEAAKIGGIGVQIIRDRVLRFNARGPDGLLDGKAPGQPCWRHLVSELLRSGASSRGARSWRRRLSASGRSRRRNASQLKRVSRS